MYLLFHWYGHEKAQVILHYLILQLLNNFRFVFANFS